MPGFFMSGFSTLLFLTFPPRTVTDSEDTGLSPDLLIVDNFSLKPMNFTQAEDFYEIVAERHLRGSIIVTSNRTPTDWLPLFPDPVMANSALDRLAHKAHHIVMKEESYRGKTRPQSSIPFSTFTGPTED